MNYSSGLLKPDCLKRGIEQKVLVAIEATGLRIIATKRVRLTQEQIAIVYKGCIEEAFYPELLAFFLSSDCMAYIVEGHNAIETLNRAVGHQQPALAREESIRYRFGLSVKENIIHSVEAEEMFWEEVLLFFDRSELSQLLNLAEGEMPQNEER